MKIKKFRVMQFCHVTVKHNCHNTELRNFRSRITADISLEVVLEIWNLKAML